ncbi:hypothetical protein Patl1_35245 [Pistacia atlantica]|uniref:Uncharacterized protein n=1 Tax=Pistacia atlantica TaxID=434234 RepID=A0ACC0ZVJ0_9ROSI|nr:hypothetical protein Patl1_35245 [Pistacia atlantica]
MARGKKLNSLYMTHAKSFNREVNSIEDSFTKLWYMRLGHLSEKGMQILTKKQLLPSLKDVEFQYSLLD